MACCLFSSYLILHPKLNYCQLYTEEQNLNLNQNTKVCFISKYCTTVLHDCFPCMHDDVIKWKHFPRYWPFVRGIHRSPVNSPHKGQWPRALMFSLICVWINSWVNNREAGDLRRYRAHYDVTVMTTVLHSPFWQATGVYPPRGVI